MTRISYERGLPGRDAPGPAARAQPRAARPLPRARASIATRSTRRSIVANSTMRDLFFGIDIAPIGELPVQVASPRSPMLAGRAVVDLGPPARPRGRAAHEPARPRGRRAAHRQPRRRGHRRGPDRHRLRRWQRACGCSSTSAPTPRSWSRTGRATSRRPARPARPSRAGWCASGCPARTAPSRSVRLDGRAASRSTRSGDAARRGDLRLRPGRHPRRAATRRTG